MRALLDELGIVGYPKTTGKHGIHVYVRLEPRWDPYQVRSAAVAFARELARRHPELVTDAWWKEERGERIFIDFNQNAPHKTVFGAWCVRARPGAQVSTPFRWDELDAIDPDALTIATVPGARRRARRSVGRDRRPSSQSLEPLLAMHERDLANGLAGRAVAARLPEDAGRTAPRRAEPGQEGRQPKKPALRKRRRK